MSYLKLTWSTLRMPSKHLGSTTNSTLLISLVVSSTEEGILAKEEASRISRKEDSIIKDLISKHIKTNSITKVRVLPRTTVAAAKTTTTIKAASTKIPGAATAEEEGEETTEN